jgi:hypothetical protein
MRCVNRYCSLDCFEYAACAHSPTTPHIYYPELPARTRVQLFEWEISDNDLDELFASVHALMDKIAIDEALQHAASMFYYSGASTSSHMPPEIEAVACYCFLNTQNAVEISSTKRASNECDDTTHEGLYEVSLTELDELHEACYNLANKIYDDEYAQFERGDFYCSQASTLSEQDFHSTQACTRSPSSLLTTYNLSLDDNDTSTHPPTASTASFYHSYGPLQASVNLNHQTYSLASRIHSQSSRVYESTTVCISWPASPIQEWDSDCESTLDSLAISDDEILLLDRGPPQRRLSKFKMKLKKWARRVKSLPTKICR